MLKAYFKTGKAKKAYAPPKLYPLGRATFKGCALFVLIAFAFVMSPPLTQEADAGWFSCVAAVAACLAATTSAGFICAGPNIITPACALAVSAAFHVCKKVEDKCN